MEKFITPNDCRIHGNSDTERIQNAIIYASNHGIKAISIPRLTYDKRNVWVLERSLFVEEDLTIFLVGCQMQSFGADFFIKNKRERAKIVMLGDAQFNKVKEIKDETWCNNGLFQEERKKRY